MEQGEVPSESKNLEKPAVFLSYGRRDAESLADRLTADLTAHYEILLDKQFMQAGISFPDEIERAIRRSRILVAILTPHSVRRASDPGGDGLDGVCYNEIHAALYSAKIPVLPVMWKRCEPPLLINQLHYIDFESLGYAEGLAQLTARLEEVLGGKAVPRSRGITSSWSLADTFRPLFEERSALFCGRKWLFEAVTDWHDHERGERLMLVTGGPGTGKSAVIAKIAGEQPCGNVLAYHCCRSDSSTTLEPRGFMRNLAFMLAQHLPNYREALEQPHMQDRLRALDGDAEGQPSEFFESAILTPLLELGRPSEIASGPGWILVDALDEAAEFSAARGDSTIVDLIATELHRLPPWLRLLATSRPGTVAAQLGGLVISGHTLTREIPLDTGSHEDDAVVYLNERLTAAGRTLQENTKAALLARSCGNFLYLKLLLDGFIAGNYDIADIHHLPAGLNAFYYSEFRRLYPSAESEEYRREVRPLLAVAMAARDALTAETIARAIGHSEADTRRSLRRLTGYLPARQGRYSVFHKSFSDWLTNLEEARDYGVAQGEGNGYLAQLCWQEFSERRGRAVDLIEFEDEEVANYTLRHGVDHLIGAGLVAQAVELLHFIVTRWDEEQISGSSLESISPGRLLRNVLLALDDCLPAEKQKIDPQHLAFLIKDFYQIEPLYCAIEILVRQHTAEWPTILEMCLGADNYVLRYAISEILGDVCAEPDGPIKTQQIYDYLNSPDINHRELGSYGLRRLYVRDPSLIKLEYLELLGESETYPARSALGDLLLNLALQKRPWHTQLKSRRFWEPVWEHNRLDVSDLLASDAFFKNQPLAADADEGTRAAYENFQRTEAIRLELLKAPEVVACGPVRNLVNRFFVLGRNPTQIRAADEPLSTFPRLLDIIRLLFSHPLWDVAETAASVLSSLIEVDAEQKRIVIALFDDPYWRVRFGAIETAYMLVTVDRMETFRLAVNRFCDDSNSRVRALCAEDLVAYILERPPLLRENYLSQFSRAIQVWLNDSDCWVLEHMFRLLRVLDRDGYDCSKLFPSSMPYLLDGLTGWKELRRETFLTHIEARQRERLTTAD
jgi:hypothetical protein